MSGLSISQILADKKHWFPPCQAQTSQGIIVMNLQTLSKQTPSLGPHAHIHMHTFPFFLKYVATIVSNKMFHHLRVLLDS